jgi:nitrous oxidase accessory protein
VEKVAILRGLCVLCVLGVGGGAARAAAQADMSPPAAQIVEMRPTARQASPLQRIIDEAPAGSTVEIPPGRYVGDIIVDRPLHLVGRGRPVLVGSGAGSVVRIRAANVLVEGVDIDGLGGGDLGRDASGIHLAAHHVTIRDCRISNTLFGVYLREADGATVERCTIRGIRNKAAGEKGSGIHIWNTDGFRIEGNEIVDVRDGLYIQSSSHGTIVHNTARDLRYGIHYMFSDDNAFADNLFENGAAGSALMYSRRITFRRNRFVHNRGFASVGLLLKACDDVIAEDNLIADNARGIFVEGSYRNRFIRNVIAESDAAIVLYDSAGGNVFEGNSFVANLSPLSLVGRRTDTRFSGNYWSDNREPDLDGDGRTDRPYRLSSVFDHVRSNLTAADLFTQGFAAAALGAAERAFPVLDAIPVEDPTPLAHPPALANVPLRGRRDRSVNRCGVAASLIVLIAGATVLGRARASGTAAA